MKNRLRLLMAERHLNITVLSEKTGISRNAIANIYHEKTTRIDLKTISKLCNFFGCTPNDLLIIGEQSKSEVV
ncbi:helix-turn-helix transcriptional regulator [Ureibacillus sp. Re31]|uniref:Helix-turn-helix transcriptional regulator n=1 Tax=Ureibacillus galli TaxID=2762222 RepID=A0ABR8X8B8_9BACL|nr:helix-turn-helix transcriptional regulator [Ureibacillus galli]MBD8025563.1 helix-turn-helix transcriptional regulator [Ureibacillus galli]